jgi:hypothetical protein
MFAMPNADKIYNMNNIIGEASCTWMGRMGGEGYSKHPEAV